MPYGNRGCGIQCCRKDWSILARPKPLDVQAPPFQPQVPPSPPINQPPSEQPLSDDTPLTDNQLPQDQQESETSGVHLPQSQGYDNTFSGVSQNVDHLPKLTLPIFGGDPLK